MRCPPGRIPGDGADIAVAYDAPFEPAEDLAGSASSAVASGTPSSGRAHAATGSRSPPRRPAGPSRWWTSARWDHPLQTRGRCPPCRRPRVNSTRTGRRRRRDATRRRRSRALGGDEERRDVALGGPARASRASRKPRGGPRPGPRRAGAPADAPPGRKRLRGSTSAPRRSCRTPDGSNRALAQARVDIAPRLPRLVYPDGRIPGPRRLYPARVRVYAADQGRLLRRRSAARICPWRRRRSPRSRTPPSRRRRLRFEFAETGGWRVVKDDEKAARRSEREPGHGWHPSDVGSGSSRTPRRCRTPPSTSTDGGSVPGDGQKVRGFGHGVEPKG